MIKELHKLRKKNKKTWRYELTVFLKQNKSSLARRLNVEVHLQDLYHSSRRSCRCGRRPLCRLSWIRSSTCRPSRRSPESQTSPSRSPLTSRFPSWSLRTSPALQSVRIRMSSVADGGKSQPFLHVLVTGSQWYLQKTYHSGRTFLSASATWDRMKAATRNKCICYLKVLPGDLLLRIQKIFSCHFAKTYIPHKDLTACFGTRAPVWHVPTHVSVTTKAAVHVHTRHSHTVEAGAHSIHWHVTHPTTCNTHWG